MLRYTRCCVDTSANGSAPRDAVVSGGGGGSGGSGSALICLRISIELRSDRVRVCFFFTAPPCPVLRRFSWLPPGFAAAVVAAAGDRDCFMARFSACACTATFMGEITGEIFSLVRRRNFDWLYLFGSVACLCVSGASLN